MKWAEIAYLDVAVTDFVRDHMLAGDAVVVIDRDTLAVRWANGVGAQWLDLPHVGAVLEDDVKLVDGAGARQLTSALQRPIDSKRIAAARTGGAIPALIQMAMYPFLFRGERNPDLAAVAFVPPKLSQTDETGASALIGLDQDEASAAIIDDQGEIVDATSNFPLVRIGPDQRRDLCKVSAMEDDRMVKRIVETSDGHYAVGVGNLSEDPARFLFLLMPSTSPNSSIKTDTEPTQEPAISTIVHDDDATSDEASERVQAVQQNDFSPGRSSSENAEWSPKELETAPIRFVWKTDRDGVFIDMSSEFSTAVGPKSADVLGRSFDEIAADLGMDTEGEVREALRRRDTWSGKSVLWPIQDTHLRVPIDLAALPYYDRDRNFEGYRGFGIARMADLVVDDPEIVDNGWQENDQDEVTETPDAGKSEADIDPTSTITAQEQPDDPFQGEPPAIGGATITPMRRASDTPSDNPGAEKPSTEPANNVIINPLSTSENDAFEKIRAELAPLSSANENNEPEKSTDDDTSAQPYGLGPDALDALPLALIIARDERVLYSNRAFSQLTGFADVDELNENGLSALFGEPLPVSSETQPGSVTLVKRDGDTIASRSHLQRVPWMGRNALMFAFELVTEPAAPEARGELPATMRDRDSERDNDRLMEENAELRAILDTATDGVITIDEKGDIRSMNSAATALFGYETGALLGQTFSVLFAHESQRQVLNYVQAMGSNGVANVLNEGREVTGQEAKGGEIKLFMTLGRLSASNGLCAVLRDISAWKQNEEALEEARNEAESASEMKSAFLAKVSHEIRTPLNAIIGFSEIMSEERFGPIGNEKYRDYLDDIKKSGRYVVDLVNDLLDISKIESGNQELLFEGVSLNETVTEVIDMLRPQANRDRIIVRTGLDPDLPQIVADQRAAKQIITNLLSNAIRYTPEGGQVVVSTRYLTNGSVTLHIRDTGVGMTREEIEGALRPFKQVSADDELRAAGTGLGLPLTRALVEANRADFAISSTPGEGTDVEIVFPAPRVLAQ